MSKDWNGPSHHLITHWHIVVLFPSDLGFSGFGDFIATRKEIFSWGILEVETALWTFWIPWVGVSVVGMNVLITRKKLGWPIPRRTRRTLMLRGGLHWVCSVCVPLPCSRTLEIISQQSYNNHRSSWLPSCYTPDIVLGTLHELIHFILTVVLHAKYPIILMLQIRKLLKLNNLSKPTKLEVNLCPIRLPKGVGIIVLFFTRRVVKS